MKSRLSRIVPIACLWLLTAIPSARSQALAPQRDNPKSSDGLAFTLNPHQDYEAKAILKTLKEHYETLRKEELDRANSPVFSQAVDLLRYLPIKLSRSDPGDFNLPNYLQPAYRETPLAAQLFEPQRTKP